MFSKYFLVIIILWSTAYSQQAFAEASHTHVHESLFAGIASWIGVMTFYISGILAFFVLYLKKISPRYLVLSLSVSAGLIHVILSPDHYATVGLEHGLFFIFMGSFQVGFGIIFLRYNTRRIIISGMGVIIGSILLYFVTRIVIIEPFVAPEGIDPIGVITKTIEMLLILFLMYCLKNTSKEKIRMGIAS